MVVREFLEQNPSSNIWLCPSESSSTALKPVKWEYGMCYEKMDKIPAEILNSELVKTWIESEDSEIGEATCIIWKNWRLDESKVD